MTITCQCGHTDAFDAFTRDEQGHDLPRTEYRCPKCALAWAVRPKGPATITATGFVMPADREIVPLARF